MEGKVISVKKRENTSNGGLFGDLERKLCDIVIFERQRQKKITCYLDEKDILNYLNAYEKYLKKEKISLTKKSLKGTSKKRIKYNLLAFPFYILSFLLYVFAVPGPILYPLTQILGLLIGISSAGLANMRSLYITPFYEEKLQSLDKTISACLDLEKEAQEAIDGKEEADLKRSKIVHQALQRKTELQRTIQTEELKKFYQKVDTILREKALSEYRGNREKPDIPEYLKKSR